MVNYDAIPLFEALQTRTFSDNLSARLMPCDFVFVPLGSLSKVLSIDCPDVAATNGRGFRFD
jgi:hypothetical protein